MVTYKALSEDRVRMLFARGIENAGYELSELLGLALGVDCRSADYYQLLGEEVSPEAVKALDELLDRRLNGEPLQYLLGEWEFYGLPIKVGRGVLIPRQDTETLVDVIRGRLKDKDELTVIDICSGSGCIACALNSTFNCEKIYCVEKSEEAIPYLEENLRRHCPDAEIIKGDARLKETVDKLPEADLIVCNPPYLSKEDMENLQPEVTFEPEMALYGGEDGLDFYRDIVRLWARKLRPSGLMAFEIGLGQEEEVSLMMIQHGLKNVRWHKDLGGINRCVCGNAEDD